MKKAWFGPKRFGYGVGPRSWAGWLTTALFVVAMIVITPLLVRGGWGRQPVNLLVCYGAITAVYFAIVSMTYDKDA